MQMDSVYAMFPPFSLSGYQDVSLYTTPYGEPAPLSAFASSDSTLHNLQRKPSFYRKGCEHYVSEEMVPFIFQFC